LSSADRLYTMTNYTKLFTDPWMLVEGFSQKFTSKNIMPIITMSFISWHEKSMTGCRKVFNPLWMAAITLVV
ncbi:hypothetical protein, partial [Legionella erythra]|uniref:hypothetical protein n=1 Tax=Legionella erythra TaxID=448 RepID=UPI001A941391